jgi:hypothetical protein
MKNRIHGSQKLIYTENIFAIFLQFQKNLNRENAAVLVLSCFCRRV